MIVYLIIGKEFTSASTGRVSEPFTKLLPPTVFLPRFLGLEILCTGPLHVVEIATLLLLFIALNSFDPCVH
jgi:hypothetical protein